MIYTIFNVQDSDRNVKGDTYSVYVQKDPGDKPLYFKRFSRGGHYSAFREAMAWIMADFRDLRGGHLQDGEWDQPKIELHIENRFWDEIFEGLVYPKTAAPTPTPYEIPPYVLGGVDLAHGEQSPPAANPN